MTRRQSTAPLPPDLAALLDYLKRSRGFDFSGYKPASLTRRFHKRMQAVGVDSYTAYVDYLEVHPDEFALLFDTVLINVTTFFRDGAAWEALAKEVLPALVDSRPPGAPIRAWSAGCATGEEAYTLAIVLAEAMGIEAFRERVKVYATDLDEDALSRARQATYSARDVENVPPELLAKYFDESDGRYTFRADLRRSVIFGKHDLMQDAPISRVDVLTCRNALMYLNGETQARILARFHFALNDRGILFLGRAETLLTQSNLFTPIDLKRRIFVKVSHVSLRDRLLMLAQADTPDTAASVTAAVRVREAAFDVSPVAQVIVEPTGQIALVNECARRLLGLTPRDVGRPLQDTELSYRPLELRSLLERAYAEGRVVHVENVESVHGDGEPRSFDVQVMPLFHNGGPALGAAISFVDTTGHRKLQRALEQANAEIESAYEELQNTNEELETTNEELQSTVEELETTNEELQSTNEELETMNEELQSTNEELQTINDELRRRSDEVAELNFFLESILGSLGGGVVVLDAELKVLIWNDRAEDLWGLRHGETVGRHFLNLDIGLPVQELRLPIRSCLTDGDGSRTVEVPATNRRGKQIQSRVTITPLRSTHHARPGIQGVILVME